MKKVLCSVVFVVCFFNFRVAHFSFSQLSSSLDDNEIALTFLNESLLMVHLKDEELLLSLTNNVSDTLITKYHLDHIPIYMILERPTINLLDMNYGNDMEFSFVYASKKFCVGYFYDCDFTYLYKDDSYIDGDIYFYNLETANLLGDIIVQAYDVSSIVSLVWDQKNYMIVNY